MAGSFSEHSGLWMAAIFLSVFSSAAAAASLCQRSECLCISTVIGCDNASDVLSLRSSYGSSVNNLLISHSRLGILTALDFAGFQNISKLTLESSDVSLDNEVFSPLTKLTRLVLVNISLSIISKEMFSENKNLKYLSLASNGIQSVTSEPLRLLSKLEVLVLTHNALKELPSFVFSKNTMLEEVDISHNKIRAIYKDTFIFDSVEDAELNMSHNEIAAIQPGAFDRSAGLTKLLLNHNRISHLPAGLLAGLRSLALLDLSHNRLAHADAAALPATSPPRAEWRLQHNCICTFGPELLRPGLAARLQGNPLSCGCGPLREAFLAAEEAHLRLNLTCASGEPWEVLRELDCPGPAEVQVACGGCGTGPDFAQVEFEALPSTSALPLKPVPTSRKDKPIPVAMRLHAPVENSLVIRHEPAHEGQVRVETNPPEQRRLITETSVRPLVYGDKDIAGVETLVPPPASDVSLLMKKEREILAKEEQILEFTYTTLYLVMAVCSVAVCSSSLAGFFVIKHVQARARRNSDSDTLLCKENV